MEQAVRRADLQSPRTTPEPDSDPEIIDRIKQLTSFEYISQDVPMADDVAQNADGEDQLEFQLFATTKSEAPAATKIRLRSPTPSGEAGFIHPRRDSKYYFADTLDPDRKHQFEQAAISGETILARSKDPAPGIAYAWKVLHLPLSVLSAECRAEVAGSFSKLLGQDAEVKKRTRPGKKYRIKIRTKFVAAKAREDAKRAQAADKDAAEKEKRNRRNREKKIKRREKERAKKAAAKGEGGSGGVGGGTEDGGSVSESGEE
ncbi:Fungal protein of unknown function (DUF2011) [Teratosphaeria destructans]|uniref:Uncharacterized protein n=1 Tax=Teratosphaeria destructans TaxID=418781 RepID=A0A9W7W3X9_9PEZI|nr:Fungal protein of unknown function (DUF2011) [Teratosphaeria destructans]